MPLQLNRVVDGEAKGKPDSGGRGPKTTHLSIKETSLVLSRRVWLLKEMGDGTLIGLIYVTNLIKGLITNPYTLLCIKIM